LDDDFLGVGCVFGRTDSKEIVIQVETLQLK